MLIKEYNVFERPVQRMYILTNKPVAVSEVLYVFPVWIYKDRQYGDIGEMRLIMCQKNNIIIFKMLIEHAKRGFKYVTLYSDVISNLERNREAVNIPPVSFTIEDVKGSARAIVARNMGYVALNWDR